MKHLSLYGRPIVKETMSKSSGVMVPFVTAYDVAEEGFGSYNREHYKDKIVMADIDFAIIMHDYLRYYGIRDGINKLDKLVNFSEKFIPGCAERRFITNFDKKQTALYQICIDKYNLQRGREVLIISEYATCGSGELKHCSALYKAEDNKDLSEFWRIFDEVKKAARFGY